MPYTVSIVDSLSAAASRRAPHHRAARSRARRRGELRGREVVDAPEAGEEARTARHDAREGEIGELEIHRLRRKAREPGPLQAGVGTERRGRAADGDARGGARGGVAA